MEKHEEANMNSFQFSEEMDIQSLISPPEAGNSFTALLELPSNEAVMLLHSPAIEIMNLVKQEFVDSDSTRNSSLNLSSGPVISNLTKRKEREKNVKMSTKKSKSVANEDETDGEKLPYVHLRAQRGQATDSHSLAERARREKINAKMKLLQELVPGCNKISGTAMVLDEIINHVQSLQHQVEFLSRRLAALHPNVNNNLDSIYSAESGSLMDGNFTGMVSPRLSHQIWQPDELTHQRLWGVEEMNPNFITEENSLLCFDSSDTLHTDQLKMEV